jgi:hydroxyacyl-ACP dehydratase HTD2-like protein with hotdog domain
VLLTRPRTTSHGEPDVNREQAWAEARRSVEALLGQRAWPTVEVLVRAADIARYHEAIGMAAPEPTADGALVAPPLFLPPFAVGGQIGVDGRRRRPDQVVIDHPALARRLMGGCEVLFEAPIRADEVISAETTFESVVEKQGRDGPMLLVTTATAYRAADGGMRRLEKWTIVHR